MVQLKDMIIKWLGGFTDAEYKRAYNYNDYKEEYDEAFMKMKKFEVKCEEYETMNKKLAKAAKTVVEDIEKIEKQMAKLKKYEPLPNETKELIEFYNNKYPTKNIKYGGIIIKTKKFGNIKPKISVCDFVTTTQSMKDWIIDKDLMFKGTKSVTNYSKHMWKIYTEFTKHTKYLSDNVLYGENERWQPNMLQMYVKDGLKWTGDCENMALFCMGLFDAAGIPTGLYRNVCGKTKLGGHSCLFAFDWRTKNWQQWETTATSPRIIGVDEKIYISKVWFSFDSEKSWSTKPKVTYTKTIS